MTTATEVPDKRTNPDAARPATLTPGTHDRLGATVTPDGVTFCVYAKRARGLDLLLFDAVDDSLYMGNYMVLPPPETKVRVILRAPDENTKKEIAKIEEELSK